MTSWYQQALTPSDVFEATIKVGVIPSADHVQTYWEVKDPLTGVLLAAGSVHHTKMAQLPAYIDKAAVDLGTALDALMEPF